MSLNSLKKDEAEPAAPERPLNVKIMVPEGSTLETFIQTIRRMVNDVELRIESPDVVSTTVRGEEQEGALKDAIYLYGLKCVDRPVSLVVPK